MTQTHTAECHCGQVKITCQGEPYPVFMCSCTLCQRRTGSPIHIGAWWPMEDVTMEGETKEFTRSTGEQGVPITFNFCPECGTSIWWGGQTEGEGPLVGYYGIAGGCFAEPGFPDVTASLYERSKQPWISAPEGTHCFAGTFDNPEIGKTIFGELQKRRSQLQKSRS